MINHFMFHSPDCDVPCLRSHPRFMADSDIIYSFAQIYSKSFVIYQDSPENFEKYINGFDNYYSRSCYISDINQKISKIVTRNVHGSSTRIVFVKSLDSVTFLGHP